jgi:hypothetical protein
MLPLVEDLALSGSEPTLVDQDAVPEHVQFVPDSFFPDHDIECEGGLQRCAITLRVKGHVRLFGFKPLLIQLSAFTPCHHSDV